MILCRRPLLIFDVDLLAAGGVAALVVATWLLVIGPWQRVWQDYRAVAARYGALGTQLKEDLGRLQQRRAHLDRIEQVVAAQVGAVPRATSLSQLLQEMTALAAATQLELLSVTPQPVVREGSYLVSQIQVSGRGRSRDFVNFLDRFAEQNPYQTLENCTLSRRADATEPQCELTWSLRLYLAPSESHAAAPGDRL